jgi:hypothetical protein
VEVYDETWKKINASDLERRLFACVRDVESKLSEGEMPFKVGILTADDRDRWAQVCCCTPTIFFRLKVFNRIIFDYNQYPQSTGNHFVKFTNRSFVSA